MSNRRIEISFKRFEALKAGITCMAGLDTTTVKPQEYENITVPRMVDINGNKYYVVNLNKYLTVNSDENTKIRVEVIDGGVIQSTLISWLDHKKINYTMGTPN